MTNQPLDAFRAEARAWLSENCPPSLLGVGDDLLNGTWGGRKWQPVHPDRRVWLERAAAKGWTAPTWPTEYGGGGLSPAEAKALTEEIRAQRIPQPVIGFGLTMIGPTLLQYGTEEQKHEHLPKICRGEIRWCQGYSEPGAGSDLAGLQARAVREGDEFVVNGQKVWTSYAEQCDWIFALVRTDPEVKKQEGITFLLIDMETPGVSVAPIKLISGSSPFCETYFKDVRVPASNVLGAIGGGWTVAKALLGYERGMIADAFGASRGARSSLADLARSYTGADGERIADPGIRGRVAEAEMDSRAFALTVQRTRDGAKAGHRPGPETSIFKVYGTELNKRRYELMVEILGPQALGWEGEGFDEAELSLTRDWLRSRGNSIEGGTSEIQLNIIAKRVLGLPD